MGKREIGQPLLTNFLSLFFVRRNNIRSFPNVRVMTMIEMTEMNEIIENSK